MSESTWTPIGNAAMSAVIEIAAERLPAQTESAATPMRLMELAIGKGASLEQLERLMALQERWEANEARKAFVKAMAAFKSEPIIVSKDGQVDFTSSKGRTHYRHATLANVVDAVVSRMGKFGLSHKWDAKQTDGAVTVTCVITHELGHSESVSLSGPRDDSGNKNVLQQVASSMTYLQRYTLMSLCGLASREMDDDGEQSGQRPEGQQEQPGLNPRGDLGKDQDPQVAGKYAKRFLAAMQADEEQDVIASKVHEIHLEVCNNDDLYVAITRMLAANWRNAISKYVAAHRKAKGL